jgi:homoserine kinase
VKNSLCVHVKVPASTANLGPGFDTIGLAFDLYTSIEMSFAKTTQIQLESKELEELPHDKTNLLYRVAAHLFQKASLPIPELTIKVKSEIPLARGLGSSAAAIVGSLVAANQLAGEPFDREQIFSLASWWEGHPDNVGASLYGGIMVASMPQHPEAPIPALSLPAPDLHALVIIPNFQLPTTKARSVLPTEYIKSDVIFNIGRSSLLVAALAQGRYDLLKEAMQDCIHQPFRANLVPGLEEILLQASHYGALGAALSGAGPTILCFYQSKQQRIQLSQFIGKVMSQHQISYQQMDLSPDSSGVQIDILDTIS